ncbi:PTS sugar transporter subunit IIA [Lactiplantibacillus fabifermentans]|uniref:PTS EIIA type-1 domain-containing protein n=1 Tax=Lactiplantibacillus fabifermentans DSM 21115 TaxID=1413187 RepID=A0A0R2NLH9_9LACO|nr:PTS glucose transporter subunit IIA [Lactiplantibacillus fabifermentans]KRO26600.1 hypothetical protein DY78_GL000780 [Lactiplantibacillus fabifermentans DSM 21115]
MGLFSRSKKLTFVAPANGQLVPLTAVKDDVFASGAMGAGYAVEPSDDQIVSPVAGTISSLFPTKHAIGIQAGELEVLVHMGIDTVDLNGAPFENLVKQGDTVAVGTPISHMNIKAVRAAGKPITTMVLLTNSTDQTKSFDLSADGEVVSGETVGTATLK